VRRTVTFFLAPNSPSQSLIDRQVREPAVSLELLVRFFPDLEGPKAMRAFQRQMVFVWSPPPSPAISRNGPLEAKVRLVFVSMQILQLSPFLRALKNIDVPVNIGFSISQLEYLCSILPFSPSLLKSPRGPPLSEIQPRYFVVRPLIPPATAFIVPLLSFLF